MSITKLGFAGRFKAVIHKADADGNPIKGTGRVVAPFSKNMITDSGLDSLATGGGQLAYCRIGIGTAAPSAADLALVNQVGITNTAGTGDMQLGFDRTNKYVWKRVSRRFAAGTIHGKNLTEVAMSAGTTGNIFCRALLKDGLGNPISISLLEDEVLDIIYEIRLYLPFQDTVVEAVVDGAPCTITMRQHTPDDVLLWQAKMLGLKGIYEGDTIHFNACWGASAAAQPLATAAPPTVSSQHGSSGTPAATWAAYVPGSYTRTLTLNHGLTLANIAGGIGAMMIGGAPQGGTGAVSTDYRWCSLWMGWSYGFNPKLNKTASRVSQVTVGIQWGRHDPE